MTSEVSLEVLALYPISVLRLDVITAMDGVEFDDAWPDRFQTRFADQPAAVLSRRALVLNKQASGRTQDLADLEWLTEHAD